MLQICRFFEPGAGARLGVIAQEHVYDLTATGQNALTSFNAWLRLAAEQGTRRAAEHLAEVIARLTPAHRRGELQGKPSESRAHWLAPLDLQEVWAAGVTYYRSREAREKESHNIGMYDKVYDAERPELFFKATPNRVVGPHDFVRARADSGWNVPEPELTAVLSADLQVVGYTIGNDVSSRQIEAENPLYLPQAKVYSRSCALGPAITLAYDFESGSPAAIELVIRRGGRIVFRGATGTDKMKRTLKDLVAYLGRENEFPNGVFLMTGTGIVPPDDYTLQSGDVVEIAIERIGRLMNAVNE